MKVEFEGSSLFVGTGAGTWQADVPTLLLQHGAGMDHTIWVLLARYFARHGFNLVVPDLPAHGSSAGTALETIEAQAEHSWRLLDDLRQHHGLPAGPLICAGHSMGALMALEMAGSRAQDVSGLLLFGVGYPMQVSQPLLDAAEANSHAAIDMITLYSHCTASQLGHNDIAGISVLNSAMALLERSRPGVLSADLQACHHYRGAEQAAANILAASPVMNRRIITGAEDRMTPARNSDTLKALLKCSMDTVDNAGHMMLNEQPEYTLQYVRQFLLAR